MDPRTMWKRALRFVLVYLLLLASWPIVRVVYAPLFRTGAQFALGVTDPFGGEIRVRFDSEIGSLPNSEEMPHLDTVVRLQHQQLPGADGIAWASSFFHGFQPTAVLLALFLGATSRPWRLQRRRLLGAGLLLHAFLWMRALVEVYYTFSKSTIAGRPALELSPNSARALQWIWHFSWEEPLANYMVPILIWVLCAFPPGRGIRAEPLDSTDPVRAPETGSPAQVARAAGPSKRPK